MRMSRGVEVGNIFKLGTEFSSAMGATFVDEDGEARPVIMGSYGIGVGRLLACIVEEYNDENGIVWPISVAPYEVHLVALRGVEDTAERIYAQLRSAGIEVLFDDRDESAGVKFNDADLIGIPIRLTVGKRGLEEGGVEMKLRQEEERQLVPLNDVVPRVQSVRKTLFEAIAARVVDVPFGA
jgi:prolyl-tRNA synthetase